MCFEMLLDMSVLISHSTRRLGISPNAMRDSASPMQTSLLLWL
ncbi:hypothetical protein Golax_020426 [Gossypium laxum]|uniref:Uncharacterized protein n=1 Tax=Gossypium laxum TaxID=34288 RepID=A0A7J9B567_9ROSI|nr:hypothetical protein [Gossypium laxum]